LTLLLDCAVGDGVELNAVVGGGEDVALEAGQTVSGFGCVLALCISGDADVVVSRVQFVLVLAHYTVALGIFDIAVGVDVLGVVGAGLRLEQIVGCALLTANEVVGEAAGKRGSACTIGGE